MKLSYRDIEPFVKNPSPQARVILVYGPDHGMMKERSKTMAKTVVPDLSDPFNVIRIKASDLVEDPERLSIEASSPSMMGGDRVIFIEDADDKITAITKTYLENPQNTVLTILEAGELSPRSSLRKLCEKETNSAAIPCYVEDERDLGRLIRSTLQEHSLSIDNDAALWLASNISGDRQKVRNELDKLITYMGVGANTISMSDVTACCGEAGAMALDDLIYATAGKNSAKALKTFNELTQEGVAFIAIIRALQTHFRKLHLAKSNMSNGMSADQAMKSIAPPIFFKLQGPFRAQLEGWSLKALETVMEKLADLEAQCKQTAYPPETLCAQAVLGISKAR